MPEDYGIELGLIYSNIWLIFYLSVWRLVQKRSLTLTCLKSYACILLAKSFSNCFHYQHLIYNQNVESKVEIMCIILLSRKHHDIDFQSNDLDYWFSFEIGFVHITNKFVEFLTKPRVISLKGWLLTFNRFK